MNLDIEISKDGYKVLKIKKNNKITYLGSKYNQKREIEKFINQFEHFTVKDNYIILGLSFGEHIQELLEQIDESSKILIIEFDNELIEYCKKDNKIKKIIDNKQIIVANSIAEVELFIYQYVNEINLENVQIKAYSLYDKIYLEKSKGVYLRIKELFVRIKLQKNTIELSGDKFFNNLLLNLKYIAKSTPVNKLQNVYKDKPAVIVSAGPSLVKNIDALKDINNAVILTGGRTLGALVEKNIVPSCLGIVDPGEVAYKLVQPYIKAIDCPLFFTEMTNNTIIQEHEKGKFFDTQTQFVRKAWKENIISLYGGGSIAHTLTNLAIYMGCNPIIFIGQDLAYTGEQGHAACSGNKWDEWSFDRYKAKNDIYVKDINGDSVRTSLLLNEYRLCLEIIISQYPEIKFINASEGGANIEGCQNRTLKDVLRDLKKEKIISMENFLTDNNKTEETITELQNNLKVFNNYINLCESCKQFLKNYKISYYLNDQDEVNKNIKKLDKLEEEIKKKAKEISLIYPIILQVLYNINNKEEFIIKSSDTKSVAFNKDVNRSEALYSGIEKVMKECYEKVEQIIKELKVEG